MASAEIAGQGRDVPGEQHTPRSEFEGIGMDREREQLLERALVALKALLREDEHSEEWEEAIADARAVVRDAELLLMVRL